MFFRKTLSANGPGNFLIQNIYATWFGDLLVRIASVLLIVYLLWTGWTQFGPQKPQADSIRTAAANATVQHIADALRENRQNIKSLTLINFADDPTNLIADDLRQQLGTAGTFLLADRSLLDKFRRSLNVPQWATAEPETALNLGKRSKTDAVLYGTVHQFETVKGRAMIHLDYHLVDCRSGETIYSGVYDNRTETLSPVVAASLASLPAVVSDIATAVPTGGSGLLRFLGWLLIILLLPVFTINFLVVMTEKRSNAVNAFVLGTYTCIGAILAWILISPNRESYASLTLFALLCLGAFWYNVQMMSFAVRQNETTSS